MKRVLVIVCLLLSAVVTFAQDPLCPSNISRSTKSYLIANDNPKDTAFLKEKCRQAGLDLGLQVLANRIPTDSKLVTPKPSKHLLKQGALQLQLPINETQTEFAVYHSESMSYKSMMNWSPIVAQRRSATSICSTVACVEPLARGGRPTRKMQQFTSFGTPPNAPCSLILSYKTKWSKPKPRNWLKQLMIF